MRAPALAIWYFCAATHLTNPLASATRPSPRRACLTAARTPLQAYKRMGSPEGVSWPNEKDRAKEALGLATKLGPTFIKLAQALSIRTDLIPEVRFLCCSRSQPQLPAATASRNS